MAAYRAFLERYVRLMEAMAEGERDQFAALVSYDHQRIDRAVSGQQAMNMQLEQLEAQRETAQREAGLAGMTLPEIIEHAPEAEREDYVQLRLRLEQAIDQLRYYNRQCVTFAEEGLQSLGADRITRAAPYRSDGRRPDAGGGSLFETKI